MRNYVIELWNMENEHPYLATDADGNTLKFTLDQHEEAVQKAKDIVFDLNKEGEWMYFITETPSRYVKPLTI